MKATPEMIRSQLDHIDTQFETFMVCIKHGMVELAAEIDRLKTMVTEVSQLESVKLFDNVKLFPVNGRKPKLLKAEQPAA
jgi:hypothetical protein